MDSKQKIMKAALRVFMRKGYAASSINDVMEESQFTKGGIYHHFSNKDELLLETVNMVFDEMLDWEKKLYASASTLKEVLEIYFSSLQHMIPIINEIAGSNDIDIQNFYRFMLDAFKKFPQIKKQHTETHEKSRDTLIKLCEQAKQNKEIKADTDCKTLSFLMNALGEGMMVYHIFNEKLEIDKVSKNISRLIWEGIKV